MTSTANNTNNGNSAVNGSGAQPPLTSDDLEEVLLELNRFEKSPAQNIPNLLERSVLFERELALLVALQGESSSQGDWDTVS